MRIAHVITRGDVGGAQTHVVELATAQMTAGDDVMVIAGCDGPAAERARTAGSQVRIVQSIGTTASRLWRRGAVQDLRVVLDDYAPDVIHGHSSTAGLLVRLVGRRMRRPTVYTAHGWPFQRGAPWHQRIASFAGEFVGGHLGDAVICLTEEERVRAVRARVVCRQRVWVIANGIADLPPTSRWHPHEGPPALVMVARFAPPKRQVELIEALSGLTALDWTIAFVGDGPQLPNAEVIARSRLGERARFLGHRDDVADVLAVSDIAILWSAYEGLPMSLLEAMRAGLCCVGSDLDGIRRLFGMPAAGVVATGVDDLRNALGSLITDAEARRALGAQARLRFEQCGSSTVMAAATRQVYEAVVCSARARRR